MAEGSRMLVKADPAIAGTALAMAGKPVVATPLFTSIGKTTPRRGMAPSPTWHLITGDADDTHPWDACHSLVTNGLGVSGGGVEFAEPDMPQQWIYRDEQAARFSLASGCGPAAPQDGRYPTNRDVLWLHSKEFSQLQAADVDVGTPAAGKRVRVAHFDTGYDPDHHSRPVHLNIDLARNFVDAARPNDATDTVGTGALNNPGHGTGTLSLLAGKAVGSLNALGGAPDAEIVPVRVADSVVLFYNSAIAEAFDYVHGLLDNPASFVHVISMSMGGLASQAWADAVNALYERGVFIVTAAGNNYDNLPTRNIVYPARFNRVVAACGVMANHKAYADLAPLLMAGNYGPDSKMTTAISAYTPNTTWAHKGCPDIVDFDGNGTSSATPQVAAAAALWIQKNWTALAAYPQDWMRAEAVRQALFRSALTSTDTRHLGRGELKAERALGLAPLAKTSLTKVAPDSANFPLFDVLFGSDLGALPAANRRMLELEALQLSQSQAVEAVLSDPSVDPAILSPKQRQTIAEVLLSQPTASKTFRNALGGAATGTTALISEPLPSPDAITRARLRQAMNPDTPAPTRRSLRVFAFDPSLGTDIDTVAINQAIVDVRWEADLQRGPVGEYIEVVDVDPASGAAYAPVDLNHPALLQQNGLTPSEGDPRFHQQMVYAVAMRTIEHFERALGRTALWSPRLPARPKASGASVAGALKPRWDAAEGYVQRLRIYPHAIRAANAFYSPDRKALLLGYFTAARESAGKGLPHGVYFAALSHDVIAHETTHALLDGLHRRFREPTNPDVLAFHEGFADIVALLQHFTLPEALVHQIRKTRGDLAGQENLLGELAVEFGEAMTGKQGGLRDAIGARDKSGQWIPRQPRQQDYDPTKDAHALGSVLVSAVFAAFLSIYKARTADLVRLATNGTGVLQPGEISADLATRMAGEAAKVAAQVLGMCIRALDYCPPVDITFGDYLRALITADSDLVPDDPRGYRPAFAAAFRDRGIFPRNVKHLSPGNLVWSPPLLPLSNLKRILDEMDLSWNLDGDRRKAYETSRLNALKFHSWLAGKADSTDDELRAMGLQREGGPMNIPTIDDNGSIPGTLGGIEVHSVRPARRIGPDGQSQTDLVVEVTQTLRPISGQGNIYRGGCTLLIDLKTNAVRYVVTKALTAAGRIQAQAAFQERMSENLRFEYFDEPAGGNEPFALLHGVN
ncbi:S8 family serine peptidase [Mesorhizobium australicum]|uniref:S8 family serine peptidase n=1 Tax=Mesorhizobium australicum TaxID=536018 RepID=UPI003339613C